jgi:hypothetical protein
MSATPGEPEKYSLDEMMERLKASPSGEIGDGELVTRPDGTQVIKVRKRKRRSNQPIKEQQKRNQRARIVQICTALFLLVIAGITVTAGMIYANSPPFRASVVNSIAGVSGASIELEEFRMNPKTANAKRMTFDWPAGNMLDNLVIRNVMAEIHPSSFLGQKMIGEEVTAHEGVLTLQIPRAGEPLALAKPKEKTDPIDFKRYRISNFQVALAGAKQPALRLVKSEASLSSKNPSGNPQLSLYRGDLLIHGWPQLKLDRALLEFRKKSVELIGMRLFAESDDRGFVELAGSVSPYDADSFSTLGVKLSAFELASISGESLGKFFSGRVDSTSSLDSNYLVFFPTQNSAPKLDVSFSSTPTSAMEVHAFPFLLELARALDDTWFEHPVFESEAKGSFVREGTLSSLLDLDLQSRGRMALRGGLSVDDTQTLSGNLEVGVTEAMITSSNDSRLNALFSPVKDGYRWIQLKISGKAKSPEDGFKELYAGARPAADSGEQPGKRQGPTFEELTRPR